MKLIEIKDNYEDHLQIGDKVLTSRSIWEDYNHETKEKVTTVHFGEVVGFTPKRVKVSIPRWDNELVPSSYEKVVKVIDPDSYLLNQMASALNFMYMLK